VPFGQTAVEPGGTTTVVCDGGHCQVNRCAGMRRLQRGLWASRCLADADLLPPDPECPRASSAIGGRSHEVPSRPEVAVDHRVRRQEPLCLTVRFEPLHLSLSSSRGSMRILSPIVQIPAGPVSYLRHDRSLTP
jgi:hypothetical protein